ncbi:hypothetical protein ABFX02_02G051100 [Erythranthe guttata]
MHTRKLTCNFKFTSNAHQIHIYQPRNRIRPSDSPSPPPASWWMIGGDATNRRRLISDFFLLLIPDLERFTAETPAPSRRLQPTTDSPVKKRRWCIYSPPQKRQFLPANKAFLCWWSV